MALWCYCKTKGKRLTAGIQIEFDEVAANFTIVPNQVIYNRELTAEARFLWLYLRSHKVGYPLGYRQMEADTGWSEVTVRKHLRALEASGLVRLNQTRVGSRNGKLLISLLLSQTKETEASTFEGSESKGLNKTIKTNKTIKETTHHQGKLDGAFSEFWKAYPRKVGKVAAHKAFMKAWTGLEAAGGEPGDILTGVALLAADPNKPSKEFLPHPSTWLNEGRWDDEPYPEREKTKEELEAIRAEQYRRRREADLAEAAQRRAEAKALEERLKADPPKRCEHDRVAVICTQCARNNVSGRN
jgi:hypothetical protein